MVMQRASEELTRFFIYLIFIWRQSIKSAYNKCQLMQFDEHCFHAKYEHWLRNWYMTETRLKPVSRIGENAGKNPFA